MNTTTENIAALHIIADREQERYRQQLIAANDYDVESQVGAFDTWQDNQLGTDEPNPDLSMETYLEWRQDNY